ncbi:hypothetical protein P0Y31_17350 [Knoellia sp. 3-2P3]|uniref:hypothetical protein n=1 Tax=unclassified Knoellia TaxID=2618719 RepID=UPI0023DAB40C|nr:hypothetical protein [Knoellia sp. 3-2P3]MDF2094119.1 hypothetical protein [Knoellia sp. 3-2P3]
MHRDDAAVDTLADGAREIDRRTIAKGVAWTVPVVIVATAAPAAAASQPTFPTVSFTQKAGSLNPATGAVTFSLTLTSTGSGQIRFTLMDGASAQGLPFVQAIAAGSNTLSFAVTPTTAATAKSVTLTYSVDNGATYQSVDVPVASPTRYVSGTGQKLANQGKASFTMVFSGSASSAVRITQITSTAANGTYSGLPSGPLALSSSGGQLQGTFTVSRTSNANTSVTITFTIDGGAPQQTAAISI